MRERKGSRFEAGRNMSEVVSKTRTATYFLDPPLGSIEELGDDEIREDG